jgi:hypothetical protein
VRHRTSNLGWVQFTLFYCLRRRDRKNRVFPYRNANSGDGAHTGGDLIPGMKKEMMNIVRKGQRVDEGLETRQTWLLALTSAGRVFRKQNGEYFGRLF